MTPFEHWYSEFRGRPPCRWQIRLADKIAAGVFPDSLTIPTGCGKTTLIDLWGWAITQRLPVPKRLYWCIDRRVVVTQTARFAESLADRVPGLQLAELRGGQSVDVDGIVDPARPALIVTTVDQLGSRLLWRPYGGISRYAAPIHAALTGNDALIVLDEAHLSEAIAKTLESIGQLRGDAIPLPWQVIHLTATPRGAEGFQLEPDDYADPILSRRLTAPKIPQTLQSSERDFVAAMVSAALKHRQSGSAVVGIVVNTVRDARRIYQKLKQHGQTTLITGRVRPPERELRLADLSLAATDSRHSERTPLFVVATSAIEVGADIDMDALVTQTCAVSSLIQRLGRLNRIGYLDQAQVTVVHIQRETKSGKNDEDACLKWLKSLTNLSPQALAGIPRPNEAAPDYPPLLAPDIDLLARTSVPIPIEIGPWLHGFQVENDCSVLWRKLPDDDPIGFMDAVPVARREIMPCPIGSLLAWLRHANVDYLVRGDNGWEPNRRIFPGALVVLPAEAGGYDEFGWAPDSREAVVDVSLGEERYLISDPDQLEAWELGELTIPDDATVRSWNGGLCVYTRAWNELPDSEPLKTVPLSDHSNHVRRHAERLSEALPADLRNAVVTAARTHDTGKSDERFQTLLGAESTPLAKSAVRSDKEAEAARILSGLPRGWRHEMRSAAMLENQEELVRYLVATHHGRGRSHLPAAPDLELWTAAGGASWHEVWARQTARLGHWGLAYLETLVRLADWFASEEEKQ